MPTPPLPPEPASQGHTPGPWRFFKDIKYGPWNTTENKQGNPHYYQWWIESDSRKCMAVLEVSYLAKGATENTKANHAITLAEVEANARLIASAPALFDALQGLLAISDEKPPAIDDHRAYTDYCLRQIAAEDKARAALAAAKCPPPTLSK